jgi:MFS family permease
MRHPFSYLTRGVFQDRQAARFLAAIFLYAIAGGLFGGVLNNYLHEILAIDRVGRGLVETPRELPGLLLFVLLALLYRRTERSIMRLAMVAGIVGLAGLLAAGTTRWLSVLLIVAWSTGEHLMMPVRSSMAVHFAQPGREGAALGSTDSVGNLGQLVGQYLVPLVFLLAPALALGRSSFLPFRTAFALGAVALAAGVMVARGIVDNRTIRRHRLYFRKKYLRYYILEAFFGARKQVFLTFAPYVLILTYGARTALIASLYGLWSLVNIFLSPALGRFMDRVGYKAIIVADGAILIVLCLLYGFAHRLFAQPVAYVCAVFVMDAVLFITGMARTMYVKAASDTQEEVTSTLSTGISVNHFVSIVIALLGGLLWERLGMEVLFGAAGVFAAGSVVFALALPALRRSTSGAASG